MKYNREKFKQYLNILQREQPPQYPNTFLNNWASPIVQIHNAMYGELFMPIYSSELIPVISNGRYFVSNFGRVYDSYTNSFLTLYSNGYSQYVALKIPFIKEWKHYYVHKLVMFYFNYNKNYKDYIIKHYDGNNFNNKLYNLDWCDEADVKLQGGANQSRYLYTEDDIRKVCKLIEKGIKPCKIEELTGVTKSVIHKIKSHISWNSISKDYNF